jgi:hypothetical protein
MAKLEYKSMALPYRPSLFQGDSADIDVILNAQAEDRWQLAQIVMPSTVWGRTNAMVAIFSREKV